MMRSLLHRVMALLLACVATGALAEDRTNAPSASTATNTVAAPSTPPPLDPATFVKFIAERNIFNPDRRKAESRRQERPRNTVTPTLTLVGTMDYAKGNFAFFDGPASEYRKTLATGGTVAGYTLTAIQQSSVTLRPQKGAPITLKIGVPLRLDNAAPVEVDGNAAAPGDSSKGNDEAPPAASGDAGDILRKLMQKRQQESK